jgi:hypothetical protein
VEAMFDVKTSFEFYEMLVADWDDLMNDKQSARKAIHCIVLANHLPEAPASIRTFST